MGAPALITHPNPFVIDHITNHPSGEIFRMGHADFGSNPHFIEVPWHGYRRVGDYYDREQGNSNISFSHDCGSSLKTELLQGDARGQAMQTIRRTVIDIIPHDLVESLYDAVITLLRRDTYRHQPHDSLSAVELRLTWMEVVTAPNGTHRITLVGDTIRVGTRNVNALVWRTKATTWELEHTPSN